MRLAIFMLISFMIYSNVESGNLKICLPKSKMMNDGYISAANTIDKIENIPDFIFLNRNQSFNITSDIITVSGYVVNINISNFKNFTLCLLDGIKKPLFSFSMNDVKIQGEEYKINGSVSDLFNIYGNGSFELDMNYFEVLADNISYNMFHPTCFGMDIDLDLNLNVNFTNLMGGDPLLNQLLNKVIGDMAPDILDYYWEPIYENHLVDIIQKVLDKYINNRTEEFADFIKDLSEGKYPKDLIGKCTNFT
ncbi:hypothetical protein HHI36_012085 [Cryptolaemus montrouzieri]|uniref:Uncharacterized protein n=1 Tax=Cryptolaemus montrouzieri TaxID=559131 RepID=A0ABD2NDZ5_9CUCU